MLADSGACAGCGACAGGVGGGQVVLHLGGAFALAPTSTLYKVPGPHASLHHASS